MTSRPPPSPGWYIVGGGLLMIGIALGGIGINQAASSVEEMHRLPMPGRAAVTLPPGYTTLYLEGEPTGAAAAVTCDLFDLTGGKVALRPAATRSTYDSGGLRGRGAFEVTLTAGGTYNLACEGPGLFQIAIGRGAGAARVLLVAAIAPALAGLIAFAVVAWRRRRVPRPP